VTEAEWLACTDPKKMLAFLRGKASDRKLRLFAVACVLRVGHLLIEKSSVKAVELAEQYADRLAGKKSLIDMRKELNAGVKSGGTPTFLVRARASALAGGWTGPKAQTVAQAWTWAWDASRDLMRVDATEAAGQTAVTAECAAANEVLPSLGEMKVLGAARAAEKKVQAGLLRCIIGPIPFRPPPLLESSWLSWHGGLLVSIAQRMYDSRDFTGMPVLADALEEAGCTNAGILGLCRQKGEHVRGCWVVDLVLGKQS
jgi:hypothetical protein